MSVLWTVIGGGIAAWVVAHVWSRYHAPGADPLGTVSEQWLAEQRLNRPDSQRGPLGEDRGPRGPVWRSPQLRIQP